MTHRIKIIFLIAALAVISLAGRASDLQVIVAQANNAYSEGLYPKAAELYKKILAAGYDSPELYYNLGNTYYKLNDLPSAILYYERARRLDPNNEDINFNLQLANTKIADKIEPLPVLFYKRWYDHAVQLFSSDEWAKLSIAALVTALLVGLLYFTASRLILRKIGLWGGTLLFLISLASVFFAWQNYRYFTRTKEAIVFSPTVTIKSSPDENSIDLFVLHEGTKVQLIDNIGTWYEIRIANGSVGWMPVNTVEKI